MPEDGDDADLTAFASDLAEQLGVSTSSILFERCFLLVEGPTEKRSFPKLFRLATGVSLREAGVVLLDAGGNTSAPKFAAYLTGMQKPVYAIVDQDSLHDRQKVFSTGNLKAHGILEDHIAYLGNPNELEELFSDTQWSDMANAHWPRQDRIPWIQGDFAEHRAEGKKFSEAVSVMVSREARRHASKPDLMTGMAESITSRNDIPKPLLAAFDRLLDANKPPSTR